MLTVFNQSVPNEHFYGRTGEGGVVEKRIVGEKIPPNSSPNPVLDEDALKIKQITKHVNEIITVDILRAVILQTSRELFRMSRESGG